MTGSISIKTKFTHRIISKVRLKIRECVEILNLVYWRSGLRKLHEQHDMLRKSV